MQQLATATETIPVGIEMTSTGVIFDSKEAISYEALESAIGQVGRMTRSAQFCLGDLINFAEHEYGSKYDEWCRVTGMTYQTLADMASVARNVPISLRNENLDFTHHRIVAAKIKTNESRREWLEVAAARKLSTRELDISIKRNRVVTRADLQREKELQGQNDERVPEPHTITLSKLIRWVEDMESKHGMVDTWDPQVRAQLRQQFQPLHGFIDRLFE